MDNREVVATPPPEWVESLDEAERDAAAGRVVSAAEVHALFTERPFSPGPPDHAG